MIKWIKSFFEEDDHIILDEDRKNRILDLVEIVKKSEADLKKKGYLKNKYELNSVVSMDKVLREEIKYKFRLPEDYFWFITRVGNGGSGPCPKMEAFKTENINYINSFSKDSLSSDSDFKKGNNLDEQLLFLGNDNASNIYIVLSGENYGSIMYESIEDGKKLKSYKNSFIEWYECWLNEVVSNELINSIEGFDSNHQIPIN